MRNPSLTAFGGGGSPAITPVMRPSAGCPKVADLATIVGHVGTDVWADDPVQGIDVQLPVTIGGLQARLLPLKAPPYSLVLGMAVAVGTTSQMGYGIALRDSAQTKLWTFGNVRRTEFAGVIAIQYSDPDTMFANYGTLGGAAGLNAPVWYRIDDDGVTRSWYFSVDGRLWKLYGSEPTGTFIVPNQAGIFVYCNGGTGGLPTWAVRFFEFTGYK